jgi:hypothetical protein
MCLFVGDNDKRRLAMRIRTIVLATLALSTAVLAQTPASALPYDPDPWRCTAAAGAAARRTAASRPGTNAWRPSAASADFASETLFYNPRPASTRSRKRQVTY